jgi:hypothetical protein
MSPALAHADLVVEPVNLAVSRANPARPQRLDRLLSAALEKSSLERFYIRRHKIFPRHHKSAASV